MRFQNITAATAAWALASARRMNPGHLIGLLHNSSDYVDCPELADLCPVLIPHDEYLRWMPVVRDGAHVDVIERTLDTFFREFEDFDRRKSVVIFSNISLDTALSYALILLSALDPNRLDDVFKNAAIRNRYVRANPIIIEVADKYFGLKGQMIQAMNNSEPRVENLKSQSITMRFRPN